MKTTSMLDQLVTLKNMKNKPQEIKITLTDVVEIMMEHGIVAGLQLERIRVKAIVKVAEQTAYEQGWMDSRF